MNTMPRVCGVLGFLGALALASLPAQEPQKKFTITPEVQKQLDVWKSETTRWAADKAVVEGVVAQNAKGPIAGMDDKKWKSLKRRSAEIEAFQKNAAAQVLVAAAAKTNGLISEAFLSAAKGEKVAFLEKTSSYMHAGKAKFDVPFGKLTAWQGEPEFDESTQTFAVQIAVPVLDPKDAKKAIGVLVVGINLTELAKPPAPAK
ncbi:MAG: hypothetical protein IPK26_09050 [Planctomycetes bacterium]|nr:hypothetical protein [Planctomycetota bacterium]